MYSDISGKSGISAYEVGDDFIIVRFTKGGMYLYNYSVTGSNHVKKMIELARIGSGLNKYINLNTKHAYARKTA